MNDVLEHLTEPAAAIENLYTILKPRGIAYVNFPPYYFPFAGHFAEKRTFLKYISFAHVFLPSGLITRILRKSPPSGSWTAETMVASFRSLNWMTIRWCRRLLADHGFEIEREEHFLVPPMYTVKYGLSPWSTSVFRHIPLLSEILDNRFSVIARRR